MQKAIPNICYGDANTINCIPPHIEVRLEQDAKRHIQATTINDLEENNRHFSEERDRPDKWAHDMEFAAQKELDDVKRQIQELYSHPLKFPVSASVYPLGKRTSTKHCQVFSTDYGVQRQSRLAPTLAEQKEMQETITKLEKKKTFFVSKHF